MRLLKLAKKVPVHPTFFALAIWFFISGQAAEFFILTAVVLLHELAHYLCAKRRGYQLTNFYLAPYGVALNYKDGKFDFKDELAIALAGPAINIILCVLILALWWIFPATYCYTISIFETSLFLALFNLLPAYPLDGGRALVAALSDKIGRKKALKISIVFNIIFCVIFFALFVVTCFYYYNPTLALMVVFLLSGILDSSFEGKYERVDVLEKSPKNLSQIKQFYVDESASLSQLLGAIDGRRFTIFYVALSSGQTKILTEKAVISLCKKYPLSAKIGELNFKK